MDYTLYKVTTKNDFKLNVNFLIDFYTPIIGNVASSFYLLLSNNISYMNKNNNLSFSYESIYKQLNCTSDQLSNAKQKLEAMGLINTLISTTNQNKEVLFVINSTLNFNEFISNTKYKILLIKFIGNTNFQYLEYKYSPCVQQDNLLDVSSTFEKIFSKQNLQDVRTIDFAIVYKDLLKLSSSNITISSECKKIIENVYSKSSLSLDQIEKAILNSIENIADKNIFQCNQDSLVCNLNKLFSINCFNLNDVQINRSFKLFESLLPYTDEQKIINDYKSINSVHYLYSIFKNNVSKLDLSIINLLQKKYKLHDDVINVIIDFSLFKTHGKLNKKYIFKIAKTFNGLAINSCEDAIKHFKNFITNKSFDNTISKDKWKLESI